MFADQRSLFGIPNFDDVVSNVPFAAIGIWSLWFLLSSNSDRRAMCFLDSRERWPYVMLFIGLLLTAFGSSYYHLSPSNARLVWDRLPMTIAFMAMVAAIIAERTSIRVGLWLLPILLLVGMGSVLQWYTSETRGVGDLRLYAAVQTYSVALENLEMSEREPFILLSYNPSPMLIFLTTLLSTLRAIFRSRAALELENLALRHPIGVLQRSTTKRPKLTAGDRMLWVFLSRVWRDWRSALAMVQPETVVAWHRSGWCWWGTAGC